MRASCDALPCGRRPFLHDDLSTIQLAPTLAAYRPLALFPDVIRRVPIPAEVEAILVQRVQKVKAEERYGASIACGKSVTRHHSGQSAEPSGYCWGNDFIVWYRDTWMHTKAGLCPTVLGTRANVRLSNSTAIAQMHIGWMYHRWRRHRRPNIGRTSLPTISYGNVVDAMW
jgi:hypothetical protein